MIALSYTSVSEVECRSMKKEEVDEGDSGASGNNANTRELLLLGQNYFLSGASGGQGRSCLARFFLFFASPLLQQWNLQFSAPAEY